MNKFDELVNDYTLIGDGGEVIFQNFEELLFFVDEIRADEREVCAKVCDGWTHADGDKCAEAIRSRGEK